MNSRREQGLDTPQPQPVACAGIDPVAAEEEEDEYAEQVCRHIIDRPYPDG